MNSLKTLILSLTLLSSLSTSKVFAQNTGQTFCYGGLTLGGACADGDDGMGIIKTLDNGYAFVTSTNISGGNIPGNFGGCDAWIVKLDAGNNVQWTKNFGGTDGEIAYSIGQASDSSFYVTGYTFSSLCGNVNPTNFILKLDPNGNIVNQRCYGGTAGSEQRPYLIIDDNNKITSISTTGSNDGDVSGNHSALYDIWVVQFDTSLNIIWQHCYGGTNVDMSGPITNDAGNGFLFGGRTRSVNGDLSLHHGGDDAWIVHIDSAGNIIWKTSIGGTGTDNPYNIFLTPDSSIYVAGYTSSNDFDINGNHGISDAWIIKLDYSGNVIWNKCYGGSQFDYAFSITQDLNGNFLITGLTYSNDFDVSGNTASSGGGWFFSIDSSGALLWQRCIPSYPLEMINGGSSNLVYIGYALGPACTSGVISLNEFVPSNFIYGKTYADFNGNMQYDTGDYLYTNALIGTLNSGLDTSYSFTNNNGVYWLYPATGQYVTGVYGVSPYYSASPPQYITQHNTTGNYDTLDFRLIPFPGIQDVQITILPIDQLRPGFNSEYKVIYSNIGTDTVNGTIYFIKDSLMTFLSAIPAPSSTSGDTIFWNYTGLFPFQTRNISIHLSVPIPPAVNSGDTMTCTAWILPITTDTVPGDNISTLSQEVVNSFDPNDKLILGNDSVIIPDQSSEFITYMIRFQNTGNAEAVTVIVSDEINNSFDINSLQLVSSSHACSIVLENNVIYFIFNNIHLPDSGTNLSLSNGYVCYKLKLKNNLIGNQVIPNKAAIYFDFNQPVITNTANLHVTSFVGLENRNGNDPGCTIYPNPTLNTLTVLLEDKNDKVKNAIILNSIGEMIKDVSNNIIDLEPFPAGIYLLKITTDKKKIYFNRVVKR